MSSKRPAMALYIMGLMVLVVFLAVGCASPLIINNFNIAPPAEKIPLRVGLYLNSAFLSNHPISGGNVALQFSGDSLGESTKRALQEVFEEVVFLDGMSHVTAKDGVKAIISPEITGAQIIGVLPMESRVTYKWTVLNRDGKIIYVNTVTGSGTDNSFAGWTRITESMTLATKNMYQKFLDHMLSTKWWAEMER